VLHDDAGALVGAAGPDEAGALPAGWQAAESWGRLARTLPPGVYRRRVQERAIDAVLAHARRLLRHAARPTRTEEVGWPEAGELDLESTLERPRPWAPTDLRLTRPVAREIDVVAILDMSLSMTGDKIALVAVAAAILRLKLEHVAVVAFDTHTHVLARVGERVGTRELVRRVLTVPAQGYTNIEGGLSGALEQLRGSGRRDRVGMLLTDGVANVGGDPVRLAARFPRLHVVHLGDHHPQGARTCRRMATAGRGRMYRARSYADLPEIVRTAIRELFRG
jgi:Mg-chelatase subunit ChlD